MQQNRLIFDVSGEPRAAFNIGVVFGILAGALLVYIVAHVAGHYAVDR